jgi:thioredoxin reductase (NADPH)
MLDLVIIGSGPAGLAAARDADRMGMSFVVIEKGNIADTIMQFPIGKQLFSTPEEIELEPGTLRCRGPKPTREELLTHYVRFVVDKRLPVKTGESVLSIARNCDGFVVTSSKGEYRTRTVLAATGINGFRKHLNVPGETDERVRYQFVEGFPFAGKDVVVAGSGNSAAEAALFLEEVGARVSLVMRRAGYETDPRTGKAEIKWWVRDPLVALVAAGRMNVTFDAWIVEIRDGVTTLGTAAGERFDVPCETVFALLGTTPDLELLQSAGVRIGDDGVPEYNPTTFETTVEGLFVAGHITHERHVKGALAVAPIVMREIASRLAPVGG